MASLETLAAFLAAAAVFAYMPGPAMLYTVAQTVARGRWAGLMAALGLHVGHYVHVAAAAAGLAVLFHLVPALFAIVKIVGALYLVWLGLSLFRTAKGGKTPATPRARPGWRAFFESVAVEVLNPKTAIFYLAFLPQFVDPGAALPVWVQFVVLGTLVNLLFSSVDLLCIVFAGALTARLRRSGRAQRLVRRLGGSLLIGLGVNLAVQKV